MRPRRAQLFPVLTLAGLACAGPMQSGPAAAGDAYRQLALSAPVYRTSNLDKGDPWRILFGYPLLQRDRFALHQDWVVAWLDVEPRESAPGGRGVSLGTDLSLQWRHRTGHSMTPYYEFGGGIQYAAGTAIPANGGRWMFTLNAGAGLLIPLRSRMLVTELRYHHISNANVFPGNAGYDAVHLVIGLRWGADD